MRKTGSLIFSFVLFSFVLILVILDFGYPRQARLVPLIIGVPTLFLIVYVIVGEAWMPRLLKHFETDITKIATGQPAHALAPRPSRTDTHRSGGWKSVVVIIAWMIVLLITVFLFGFLIGLPLFILAYLKVQARAGWTSGLLVSAIAALFFYLGFGLLWPGQLFQGILFGAYVPPL